MTLPRENVGDVEYKVTVYRDGKELKNSEGYSNVKEFVPGIEIFESLNSATLEARLIIQDAAGFLGAMTGSELFRIQIKGTIVDKVYFFRAYEIESRSRYQGVDTFIINCASDEFIRNEIVNIFGHSEVIFQGKTESSEIIKQLLSDKRFVDTPKKLFLEQSINKHQFISPNWRPFDVIYWLCQRSVRQAKGGGGLQNGFVFWENSLGYHFKSLDNIIDSVNSQNLNETNPNKGTAKLYTYAYSPSSVDDGAGDTFKINGVTFPDERNFLSGLRHGTWSGYSIGFDPVTITESKVGLSADMSVDAYRYNIGEMWGKMSHLNKNKTISPIKQMDSDIQALIDRPKRVRYSMLPNQNFDPKYQDNPQKNYEELTELQAYQYLRIESFKNIKLSISVPGNLDLYAGYGVNVVIPGNFRNQDRTQIDKKYSGRYVIAGLTHKILDTKITTDMLLVKDSVL